MLDINLLLTTQTWRLPYVSCIRSEHCLGTYSKVNATQLCMQTHGEKQVYCIFAIKVAALLYHKSKNTDNVKSHVIVSILNQFPAAILCHTVYAAGCDLWLMWSANCWRNVLRLIVKRSLRSVAAFLMLHTKHEQSYMSRCGTWKCLNKCMKWKTHFATCFSCASPHIFQSCPTHTYASRSLRRTSSSRLHARRSYQFMWSQRGNVLWKLFERRLPLQSLGLSRRNT